MNESLLVNTLGHSAGILIFGIFLYLLIQDRASRRLPGSRKSMLAALLALLWNLASLIVLAGPANATFTGITVAAGFSVLSLLPAVLFDLCLRDRFRILVKLGYGLSAVSIALHLSELRGDNPGYHRLGLALITLGYGALTGVAAAGVFASRDRNRRAMTSRLVGTMSLFLLAMSFVHLRSAHLNQIWSHELAFHHAAIPLALLVLLQDYRFVLVDAFLRFLANVFLASLFTFGAVEAWRLDVFPRAKTPFFEAMLLASLCLLLILFALARTRLQSVLTKLVFRQPDREMLLDVLKAPIRDEQGYLETAAAEMGRFMGAEASLSDDPNLSELELGRPALSSELSLMRGELEQRGVEAVVRLRVPSGGARHILLGRRSGGRRYLSEDLQALGRAAALIEEQIEQYRESEMRRLVAQAELRALQSQIHPHFLFNALNTLYGIIPREAKGARDTVLNLADIFRYFLETERTFSSLEEELHIVRAYLDVERLRLGAKLHAEIDADHAALEAPIPILSIQPLVENAVKHGIAPKPEGGAVRLEIRFDENGGLRVTVRDTGGGFAAGPSKTGVGLDNVRRRLQLCYGSEARLQIDSSASGSAVSFRLPAPAMPLARAAEIAS